MSNGSTTQNTVYRAAFQQILPEVLAVEAKELLIINIDVTAAVATAMGALPEIMAMRERASKLPGFEIKNFDLLEAYALAMMHVQGEYVGASTPPEELATLNEQGIALRDVLHSDATALARRGLMSGERLPDLKTGPGYKVLAEDLVGLSALLRNNWAAIGTKTAITLAELDSAENLSEKLLSAVGAREQGPAVLAEVALRRQSMFTLFARAYDQIRRAISYFRWSEDDLESIAPSLYSGRGNVRRKAEPQPATPPAAAVGAASDAPLNSATPAVPGTGGPLPAPIASTGTGATVAAAPGLPGSVPFIVKGS